jgi:hypothetical protein
LGGSTTLDEKPNDIQAWTRERLVTERNGTKPHAGDDGQVKEQKSSKLYYINSEIERRFMFGYGQEQLSAFYKIARN